MAVDWKPQGPRKASRKEWADLREAKHGPCRACNRHESIEMHHLVGGNHRDDTADNLVPLCHACHHKYEDHAPGWQPIANKVFQSLTQSELAYCLRVKGIDWCIRYFALEDAA